MLSFTPMLLATLITSLIFLQITQAFCVYNKLSSDASSIDIYTPLMDDRTSFKKVIYAGQKECCHFSNKDCNPSGDPNRRLYFQGWLNFQGQYREGNEKLFACAAGGGLNIFGTSPDDAYAICVSPDGSQNRFALWGNYNPIN